MEVGSVVPRGRKGRYIMVTRFSIGAISPEFTIRSTTKCGESVIGRYKYRYLVGKLPNGNLIGKLTTYGRKKLGEIEELRTVIFIVTPNKEVEFIGCTPEKKLRILRENEVNFIISACLDYGFYAPRINPFDVYKQFKHIEISKIF